MAVDCLIRICCVLHHLLWEGYCSFFFLQELSPWEQYYIMESQRLDWLGLQYNVYHLVMTNSLPSKITMVLIGKPSISMGHLYHGYVSHNQMVVVLIPYPKNCSRAMPTFFLSRRKSGSAAGSWEELLGARTNGLRTLPLFFGREPMESAGRSKIWSKLN